MPERTGRLRRADRLLRPRQFQRVQQYGSRAASASFVVLVANHTEAEPHCAGPRIGITVSRKVGNAVLRNRVKRRVREWFRSERRELRGVDVLVIARPPAPGLSWNEFGAELRALVGTAAGRQS